MRGIAGHAACARAGGCASGAGGVGNADASRTIPNPQRTVVRVAGYRPVDIYNEPGIGTRTIDIAAATIWRVVGGVYAELDIPVDYTRPASMEIGNQGYRATRIDGDRMNTFLDCGADLSGPLASRYEITLAVMTRVTAKDETSSEILTMVDAFGRPPRSERQPDSLPIARNAGAAGGAGNCNGARTVAGDRWRHPGSAFAEHRCRGGRGFLRP